MNKLIATLFLTLGITNMVSAAGNPEAGKEKVTQCVACHGVDGNGIAANFPKIAGQGERYLLKQLHDVQDGVRSISEMIGQLDDFNDQDLEDIAAYFSGLDMSTGAADPELVELGESLYRGGKLEDGMPSCIGCHGPDGKGVYQAGFPKLGGQHKDYIVTQLTNFREGIRVNDGDTMIMRSIAAKLSNKEIEAISSYIEGLN